MARLPRATLLLLTITANAAFFGRQRRKPDVPPGGLACDDGYTAVPSSYINDDYCDCADGADEPRTAACSGVTALRRFACADGSGVPASRVGDGVCDCCDGKDEAEGTCEDTCAAAAEAAAAAAAAAEAERQKGIAKRAEYVEQYKSDMADAETRRDDAQRLLDEIDIDGPREKVASYEKDATALRDAAVAKADADEALKREAALIGEAPSSIARAAVALCVVADNMEALLENVHENLPSDAVEDADVLSLGHDALEALNDAQDGEEAKRADAASLARTRLQGLVLPFSDDEPTAKAAKEALAACATTDAAQAKQRLVPLYDVGGALAGKLLPVERTSDDVEDYLSSDASEAKKQLAEAEATKKTAETALRDAQKILDNDAGPDGAYHVLRDRCFSVKVSQYTYEVCAFGRAKQDHTRLGSFREWRADNTKWYFGGGQHCAGRGARDLVVSLLCGSEERLGNVGEPETCSYSADLYTPAACG